MPVIKGLVTAEGGLVRISVGCSHTRIKKLRLAHRPVPVRLETMALLDTGAEITCLNSKLIEELDLPYNGAVLANAPGLQGATFASQYDASLTIMRPTGQPGDHLIVRDLSVLDLPLNLIGYQAVIGRDVLSRCKFLYNGIEERYALKY